MRARARATAITKINIKHNKGRGPDDPAYIEAVNKIREIFGNKILENAMRYGKAEYIQKLIDLIKMEKSKHSTTISNEEQITKILRPALQDLLNYIRDDYTLYVPFYGTTHPLQLVIPRVVSVNTVLSPKRINDILAIAEKNKFLEDQLIEEFIQNLEVLKTGFASSVVVPDLPYASLPARPYLQVSAPLPLPPPPPTPPPTPLLPPPLPRPPTPLPPPPLLHPSSYKSPRKPIAPLPVPAIKVRVTTTKNPDAIRVNAENVLVINRVGQGKNYKKTTRHK